MLEKIVNQPTANPSGVFVLSQMWLWSQRPHVLAIQAIILVTAMNLLCWALVVVLS